MGKPLIHWTVKAALTSGICDRVTVNTDDIEIAEAAQNAGAEVPFMRPPHLATNEATTFDVVEHAITTLKVAPDYIVLLQPTSPLRSGDDIRSAFALIERTGAPAVVSVSAFDKPWPVLRRVEASVLNPVPEPSRGAPTHQLNGAIYIERLQPFLNTRSFTPPGALAYEMPRDRSIDVDTALDFKIAHAIALECAGLFHDNA
ncbi:N-acylneuraminate cytidylyltransferase [Ciceribacter lividus]|uniref:N-acylneuraminate cytidylyltransferase n=2 Tax=Ciceribacter lividus TaxID=1197950 RepID=A0A6I7HL05_9HYPH|nr:N-acylneuraminate cytidylyltransferase [Ciceribacter lividus]